MKNLLRQISCAAGLFAMFALSSLGSFAATPMVSSGWQHTLALQSDGTVLSWGSDEFGQLGIGRAVLSALPLQVPGLDSVKAISSGANHLLVVKQDGTAWAWGANSQGQLGDGSTTDRSNPVQVQGLTGAVTVASGLNHSLARKQDGTVWTWGVNRDCQSGNGTGNDSTTTEPDNRLVPVPSPGVTGVATLSVGGYNLAAFRPDGKVWAARWAR